MAEDNNHGNRHPPARGLSGEADGGHLTSVTLANGEGRILLVQDRDEAHVSAHGTDMNLLDRADVEGPTEYGTEVEVETIRPIDGDIMAPAGLAEMQAQEAAAEQYPEDEPGNSDGEQASLYAALGRLQAKLSVNRLLLAATTVGMLAAAGFGVVMAHRGPEVVVMRDQAVRPAVPLDRPVEEVQEWAADAVSRALASQGVDWRASARLQDWFTPEGWTSFQSVVGSIAPADPAMPFAAQLLGNAEIVSEGTTDGRYAWQLRQSLRLWREVEGRADTRRLVVDILVARVPETEHARGLAIARLALH